MSTFNDETCKKTVETNPSKPETVRISALLEDRIIHILIPVPAHASMNSHSLHGCDPRQKSNTGTAYKPGPPLPQ